jgi:hypothetical protein
MLTAFADSAAERSGVINKSEAAQNAANRDNDILIKQFGATRPKR